MFKVVEQSFRLGDQVDRLASWDLCDTLWLPESGDACMCVCVCS